jgi:hypothetical protein
MSLTSSMDPPTGMVALVRLDTTVLGTFTSVLSWLPLAPHTTLRSVPRMRIWLCAEIVLKINFVVRTL